MTRRPFAVLDRDGTIIVEQHYLSDPSGVQLLPGSAIGLGHMHRLGLGLVVITNQSAIGRGLIDHKRLQEIHGTMLRLLEEEGVYLDGIYVCPHLPEKNCSCRKPGTKLLRVAGRELGFEPRRSFVIGDKACDIELGKRVRATTFLVRSGYGEHSASEGGLGQDYTVDDLQEAATVIERILGRNFNDHGGET